MEYTSYLNDICIIEYCMIYFEYVDIYYLFINRSIHLFIYTGHYSDG